MRDRVAGRIQLTTDGLGVYPGAVEVSFRGAVDFGQLVKEYKSAVRGSEVSYSPAVCTGANRKRITGQPEKHAISTGHVERYNLTIWMRMRRFTRLTNASSKKIENLAAALALHFVYY